MPDPYNTELTRLRTKVQEQYSTWKFRIAKKDFYTALKRKRITNRECVLLLTEFAHTYIEMDGEEIVKGKLPVKLSEAEEFLKLRIDGQEDCTEISLDADQALKNYLSRGISSGGTLAIEGIHDLSSKIYSCVEFTEGDRVIVKDEEDIDDYEEESDDSSDEGLKSSALVSRRSKTGSVVFSTATLCFIHFDGEAATTPTPIPIRLCSKLDELPFIEEKKKESPPVVTDDENEDDVGYVVSTTDSKTEEEEEEEDTVASKPQQKARTVEEALIEGGWKLKRSKNHLIYSRRVKIDDELRKQSVAMAKTPSDYRADKKALSLLRKLNEALQEEDDDLGLSSVTSVCKECLEEKSNMKFSKTQLKKAEKNRKCKACCGS